MENLILSLNVVLPLFITMSLGYFLKSLNMFDNNTLDTMNNITFKSFLPMLLFYNIYNVFSRKKSKSTEVSLYFYYVTTIISNAIHLFLRDYYQY